MPPKNKRVCQNKVFFKIKEPQKKPLTKFKVMMCLTHKLFFISILSLSFAGLTYAAETSAPAAQAAPAAQPAPAPKAPATVAPASAKPATQAQPASQAQPAAVAQPASVAQPAPVVRDASLMSGVTASHGATATLDDMIQAKLDSLTKHAMSNASTMGNADSVAKVKADSVRKLIQGGKYVKRATYDKSNFDSWKIDTVLQKNLKSVVVGTWRTPIVAHGHAFRDAELSFGANDTLYGVTRTYSDSGRYQMTGEYAFLARYRFDNDSSIVTREVFSDRKVIRWDFIQFKIDSDTLKYNLKKLEFRDLNDNWLNALQGFDNVPAEVYIRDKNAKVIPASVNNKKGPAKASFKKK